MKIYIFVMRSFMHQRVNDPFSSAVVCLWGVYTVTPPPKKKKRIAWCICKMCMQDIQIVKSDGYCLKMNWIFVLRWDKLQLMSLNALALCPVNKTLLWFLIILRPFPSSNTAPLEPHSYCFSCWTSPFQNPAISSMLLAS